MSAKPRHYRYLLIATTLILLGALTACQPAAAPAPTAPPAGATTAAGLPTLSVLAAESFIADMAQNVAGDRLNVETLMPLGLDPHAFEPTPQDVGRIADSQVLIVNGGGFEEWLQEVLDNAGGQRQVIEASAGLAGRSAREGETSEMSDEELGDAMCAAAAEEQEQPVTAGAEAATAAEIPAEAGLFMVTLAQQADGAYGGTLKYATDEAGDFQMATGPGTISVFDAAGMAPIEIEKTLALSCAALGLAQGNIVELAKDSQSVIELSGFQAADTPLLIGPAGGHHHHDAGDPHFWLDPTKAIAYVENIRDGLSQADPAGKDVYAANAAAYIAQLQELDTWITQQVQSIPAERRQIVTNHESFGYFADRYGFTIIGTVVPSVSTGSAPSAQQLARLVDRIKATGAPAIFLETGANPQLAQQVAAETGVKVVTDLYSHSITPPDGAAPTYIDMMRYNTQAVVLSLIHI